MTGDITIGLALVLWAITGCLIGLLFGLIMGTGKRGGFFGYVIIGTIGALIGGPFIRILWFEPMLHNWQVNIMAGSVGALLLLAIAEYSHQRRGTPKRPR